MNSRDDNDIADLRALAQAMDTRFRGPFGWRFGWDGLLGLIPVAGDVITNSISVYIIVRAAMIGCTPSVIARMAFNLGVENLVDVIPFFGNLFDFVWKANSRNLQLVERFKADPRATTRGSRVLVLLLLLLLLLIVLGSLYLAIAAIRWVVQTVMVSPGTVAI